MSPPQQDPNTAQRDPNSAEQRPTGQSHPRAAGQNAAEHGLNPVEHGSMPAERGRLQISTLVLRKIAEHAAGHYPGAVAPSRRRGGAPDVSARVRTDGQDVDVELDVALVYPQPVRQTARRLRAAVAKEIDRLTGRKVRRVAVTVVALRPHVQPRVR
jgi:uncharacterized alkaline shock family protein YloU